MKKVLFMVIIIGLITSCSTNSVREPSGRSTSSSVNIDTHFHFLTPGDPKNPRWAAFSDGYPETYAGAKQALQVMDQSGVDKVVGISAAYFFLTIEDAAAENTFASTEVAKNPNRLIGFCGVNVLQPWALSEMDRCKNVLKLSGLKLHLVSNKVNTTLPEHVQKLEEIFKRAEQFNWPILIHAADGETEFRNFVRLSWKFSKVNFIIAHARNANYREILFVPAVLDESPSLPRNLYLDVSGTLRRFSDSPEREMIVWYLRKFGIDRVFMGSDYPVHNMKKSFESVDAYPLTSAEKNGIRGANFEKLMRLYGNSAQ